jgi:RNA polymerase sigma factor (sigma-70 family)
LLHQSCSEIAENGLPEVHGVMIRTPVGPFPQKLERLLSDGVATGLTDQELLERFATSRDANGELAFATLVARHAPMVMNVCRRMLRNPADADDAFQATFLVLVRRAGAVRFETSLGPWLYGVSVKVARRAREQSSKRRGVELDENAVQAITGPSSPREHELKMLIDDELSRLPANFRAAIVSCYLEGLTHEEAAVRLRCPVGTVRSRLARGRALLKDRLTRSGVAPEVCRCDPLAILVVSRAHSIVPSQLIDTTARTAARLATGQALAALVPAGLAQLVAGASRTMAILKMTAAASLVIFGGLAAYGAMIFGPQPGDSSASAPVAALRDGGEPAEPLTPEPAAEEQGDDDPMASYRFKIDPNKIREYPELTIRFQDIQLTTGSVAVAPIECQRGTTGAVILGTGKFAFKPKNGKSIEGTFRSVVLRFNPADQPSIIPAERGKLVKDFGAFEMSRHILAGVFDHCYHRGDSEVLIPAKGAIAAMLFSKDHGDLLISEAGKEMTAFNFTSRKMLYQSK